LAYAAPPPGINLFESAFNNVFAQTNKKNAFSGNPNDYEWSIAKNVGAIGVRLLKQNKLITHPFITNKLARDFEKILAAAALKATVAIRLAQQA